MSEERHDGTRVAESPTVGGDAATTSPAKETVDQRPAHDSATERQAAGRVALVGGGPGQEDLITVRGQQLLDAADVVVADRLGPRGLLDTLRDDVILFDVGKTPGCHAVSQDEINAMLVEHALAGRNVVRLKGGDPFVLGRGTEERDYCQRHGVTVELVPGVSSALAVPAAVGIPLTHRGYARGFSVITGHDDLDVVPRSGGHTLVILMGVRALEASSAQLIDNGFSPDTPTAIIESGWTDQQRLTLGRLGQIAEIAAARKVGNPAVIVIGDVVTLADSWSDVIRNDTLSTDGTAGTVGDAPHPSTPTLGERQTWHNAPLASR